MESYSDQELYAVLKNAIAYLSNELTYPVGDTFLSVLTRANNAIAILKIRDLKIPMIPTKPGPDGMFFGPCSKCGRIARNLKQIGLHMMVCYSCRRSYFKYHERLRQNSGPAHTRSPHASNSM